MRTQKSFDLVEVALMSGVLCVIAPFTVPAPFSPVPFSFALFGVYLAALLLGAGKGTLCVLVYLILGAVGLPVFAGFSGGAGVLFGPTGGYLLGYLICALLTGALTQRKEYSFFGYALILGTGTLFCYAIGTLWFVWIMGTTYTFTEALLICVVPYLAVDVIKILAAAAVAPPVKKIVRRIK